MQLARRPLNELLQALAVCGQDEQGHELDRDMIKYRGRLSIGDNVALETKLITELHASAVNCCRFRHASGAKSPWTSSKDCRARTAPT